jgi:hypothetical protein
MKDKNKNLLQGNTLKAGGNVHIGDNITYHQITHVEQVGKSGSINTQQFVEILQDMIANGQIKNTIPKLRQFTKETTSRLHPEVIQLSDRWEAFEQKCRTGRLSNSEQNVERAQITGDLLDLLGKLDVTV